jgi:hypothetical protein
MSLKAVEALKRPPLTDIPQRLRVLADELPAETSAVIVITYPDRGAYQFGDMLTIAQACGMMSLAIHDLAAGE